MTTKKPKIKWLDREVWTLPFHLVLCASAKRYDEVLDWMKVPAKDRRQFPSAVVAGGVGGFVSMFEKDDDMPIYVVCVVPNKKDPARALSTIVHEAVHVWQEMKESVSPNHSVGREPEAYVIQSIYDTLMAEYARQVPTSATPARSRRAGARTRRTA